MFRCEHQGVFRRVHRTPIIPITHMHLSAFPPQSGARRISSRCSLFSRDIPSVKRPGYPDTWWYGDQRKRRRIAMDSALRAYGDRMMKSTRGPLSREGWEFARDDFVKQNFVPRNFFALRCVVGPEHAQRAGLHPFCASDNFPTTHSTSCSWIDSDSLFTEQQSASYSECTHVSSDRCLSMGVRTDHL